MASKDLRRIRLAVLDQRYNLTEHAYDEMEQDCLDVLDIESVLLTGQIQQTLTRDARGKRFEVVGQATDLQTQVGVVVRFVRDNELLVLTIYEMK